MRQAVETCTVTFTGEDVARAKWEDNLDIAAADNSFDASNRTAAQRPREPHRRQHLARRLALQRFLLRSAPRDFAVQ